MILIKYEEIERVSEEIEKYYLNGGISYNVVLLNVILEMFKKRE